MQAGDLRVVAPQVSEGLSLGAPSGERRARQRARLSGVQLAVREAWDRRPQACPQQARPVHCRPSEGDHSVDRHDAVLEQLPDCDRILVSEVPDLLVAVHRIQHVNVQAGRSAGVWAFELLQAEAGAGRRDDRAALGLAHEDRRSGSHLGERFQAAGEVRLVASHDRVDVSREWIGVCGRDEERVGPGIHGGNPSEWPGAQRCPKAGFDEQRPGLLRGELRRVSPGI